MRDLNCCPTTRGDAISRLGDALIDMPALRGVDFNDCAIADLTVKGSAIASVSTHI
jgi:hypothetical protein